MNEIKCLIQWTAVETLNHGSSAKIRFFFKIVSNIINVELNKFNKLEIF